MKTLESFIALNRFGLGPAPHEAALVEKNPKAWIKAQIKPRQNTPEIMTGYRRASAIIEDLYTARMQPPGSLNKKDAREIYRNDFVGEVVDRARHMITTTEPFAERMVMFWSNHFTVSSTKGSIGPVTPAYEREAIRPHIFGKFSDMLKAVIRHPVMLTYLDNHVSMGANSSAGLQQRFRTSLRSTLNENLAREVLELHTLGVSGGYGQDDIIGLAKAISGWSVGTVRLGNYQDAAHGKFHFNKNLHEPGRVKVLGKSYGNKRDKTGIHILEDLANHPSTAEHIATKLVRHFVADNPPMEAVSHIATIFARTEGDLAKVSAALVDLKSAWEVPAPKVKSHYELVISAFRAIRKSDIRGKDLIRPLQEFGQVPFSAPSPAGWPDEARHWIGPESLMRRIEWLRKYASGLPISIEPDRFLDDLIGPVGSELTRLGVARATSMREALALILASPEFQRR